VALACLLLALAQAASAQTLGRLFFSVDERFSLNQMRENDVEIEPDPEPARPGSAVQAPKVGEVSFDGRVQRSDGQTTIWVNGKPLLPGNSTVEGISVESTGGTGGETRFSLPSGAGFELKVGQKVQVVSGKVLDSYETKPADDTENVFSAQPGVSPGGAFSASPGAPGAPNSPLGNPLSPGQAGASPAGQTQP
jgi:hypothetical protein